MGTFKDLTGKTFNRLTVLEKAGYATWIQQANNRRRPKKIKNQYGEWDYKMPLPEPWKGEENE